MIVGTISFNPILPLPVIGLILAFLFIVFFLKERSEKKGVFLRVLFILLALTGIMGLFLNPSLPGTSEFYTVLLTPGYEPGIADSLLNKYRNSKIVISPSAADFDRGERLPSLNSLALSPPDIIIGDGIPGYISDMIPESSYVYFPSRRKEGFAEIQIPQKIYENRFSVLNGIFQSSENATLVLYGPTGMEDSIPIPAGHHSFELNFQPKTTGRFTYQIHEQYPGRSYIHSVPVEVIKPAPLSVLMLLDYPTFESRDLKNFLSKNHEVKVRYRVSKGIYRYEYHHTAPSRFNQLSNDLLDKVDLIIIDNESFTNLRAEEKKLLDASVQSGLGLFFLLNESPEKIPFLKSLLETTFKTNPKDSTLLQLSSKKKIKLPVWNVHMENNQHIRTLYENNNALIAGYREKGIGKIGFSFWKETYPLLLDGDSMTYSALWTPVLEKTARKSSKGIEITIEDNIPIRVNEPISFRIESTGIKPEVKYLNSIIPLREDAFLDEVWYGQLWVDQAGWNKVNIDNDSSYFTFFVHSENEWVALHQQKLMKNTRSASARSFLKTRRTEMKEKINPLWFFILFISGITLLWLWPKLSENNTVNRNGLTTRNNKKG